KQIAIPAPKAAVIPRRCSAQSLGSRRCSPKCRSSQWPCKARGEGRNFFSRRRGIGVRTVPDWRRCVARQVPFPCIGISPASMRAQPAPLGRFKARDRTGGRAGICEYAFIEVALFSGIMRRRSFLGFRPRGRWMWEIVRAGGPLMWPIILCSIVAAAIVLERLWTLQDRRVMPRELPQKVWALIEANQINDKVIAALEQNSPLGRLLAAGLANRHRPREILMERLEDTGRHVVYELERFLNTLGTIAGVSPLL